MIYAPIHATFLTPTRLTSMKATLWDLLENLQFQLEIAGYRESEADDEIVAFIQRLVF